MISLIQSLQKPGRAPYIEVAHNTQVLGAKKSEIFSDRTAKPFEGLQYCGSNFGHLGDQDW